MRVHIIDQNTLHRHLIARMVVGAVPELRMLTFAKLHEAHSSYVQNADIIIVSGGTWLVHKNPRTHQLLMEDLTSSQKPVLGVCLGAEAIANFFGAKLVELPQRQSGVHSISLLDASVKNYFGTNKVRIFEHHKWAIRALPPELIMLADSETGVEFFKHQSLPLWGTQFHPEVRRGGNVGYRFFDYIIAQVKKDAMSQELISVTPSS